MKCTEQRTPVAFRLELQNKAVSNPSFADKWFAQTENGLHDDPDQFSNDVTCEVAETFVRDFLAENTVDAATGKSFMPSDINSAGSCLCAGTMQPSSFADDKFENHDVAEIMHGDKGLQKAINEVAAPCGKDDVLECLVLDLIVFGKERRLSAAIQWEAVSVRMREAAAAVKSSCQQCRQQSNGKRLSMGAQCSNERSCGCQEQRLSRGLRGVGAVLFTRVGCCWFFFFLARIFKSLNPLFHDSEKRQCSSKDLSSSHGHSCFKTARPAFFTCVAPFNPKIPTITTHEEITLECRLLLFVSDRVC